MKAVPLLSNFNPKPVDTMFIDREKRGISIYKCTSQSTFIYTKKNFRGGEINERVQESGNLDCAFDEDCGVSGDAFLAACETKLLGGGGFDGNSINVDAHHIC